MGTKKVLFVGDSITDAGRDYENGYHMGYGYATLVAASLGMDHPNEYVFQNKGISGNRVIDLLARIKADMVNLKPDYMSILIGVNDIWHELNENPNGVDIELFETYYDMLLGQLLTAMPDLKIMILEPFLTHGTGTDWIWDTFRQDMEKRAAVAKKLAEKYALPFVPLMSKFDEACKIAPAEYWTHDGVHPTASGHELIKRAWLAQFPG